MISDSSRDYALSHLQYSKTIQTNHNFRILNISVHSPGDSEKMPEDVFIDWRFKLVESKNIGRTLNLCIWAVLCVTSRHVLRWRTPPKHQVTTFILAQAADTWRYMEHCQTIHCSRMCLTKGHCFFKKYLPENPYCKFCPFWRAGQTKQINREKMTNIRFPASRLKWINSQTTEIIWSFKAWFPKHVRQGSDSMGWNSFYSSWENNSSLQGVSCINQVCSCSLELNLATCFLKDVSLRCVNTYRTNLWVDGKEASSIPGPTSFSHAFSRPLHITILEPETGYLPHCEKGWFVRCVNTMKIGCPSWPYLKICVCCWTRSLLPSWVDQFCYHQASVTTSVYVDGYASVKLLLYAMGAEMLNAVSNFCDDVSFTPDVQTRGQGLVEAELPYETDG